MPDAVRHLAPHSAARGGARRHAAGPDPAAAESRSVLRGSASRDEISIVDATGFAMQLDIWLIHLREFGNLKRAIEALAAMVADGRYDVAA
jgi:hypothetical protein